MPPRSPPPRTHAPNAHNTHNTRTTRSQLSDLLTNASDVNIVDASNRTALHLAALGGHVAAMDRLLCGAFNVLNYQVCKRHHERPCACYNQNLEVNVL